MLIKFNKDHSRSFEYEFERCRLGTIDPLTYITIHYMCGTVNIILATLDFLEL